MVKRKKNAGVTVYCSECRTPARLVVIAPDDEPARISIDGEDRGRWSLVVDKEFQWSARVLCPSCQAEELQLKTLRLRQRASLLDPQGHPLSKLENLELKIDYEYRRVTGEHGSFPSSLPALVKKFREMGGTFQKNQLKNLKETIDWIGDHVCDPGQWMSTE